MKIALDYDETYTADPYLWDPFIRSAKYRGHSVTFVTFRYGPDNAYREDNNADIKSDAERLGIDIVFCNHHQKSHCFKADIWIDDMPILIPTYTELSQMKKGCEVSNDTGEVKDD